MKGETQEALFAQMAVPAFYPHPAATVEIRETHISTVFLAGDRVYKIKKPVNLAFLDFTTLEKRRHYCLQELTLNRRLTRDVYLEVAPITRENGGFRLRGAGEVVEYAVVMRRLSEADVMTRLLGENRLTCQDMEALSALLTDFYAHAVPDARFADAGAWETVRENCEENFRQMAPFSGTLVDERLLQIISAATRSFLHCRKALFEDRVWRGKIRDCHGDLKTGHVYFTRDGIQIIDCIEFNDRFRFQDIASDLAFLAMDMDFAHRPAAAESLINDYAARSGDADVFVLMDFYKCYRAAVQCKVRCIRLGEGGLSERQRQALLAETAAYLDLAYGYAIRFTRPTLWVVCGLPASGKSTVSEKLAAVFRIQTINSDRVRKQLFDIDSRTAVVAPPETDIYSRDATALTYGRMLILAQSEMEKGNSVILDATFSQTRHRSEAARLARDMDASLVFVECAAPDAVLAARLQRRETEGSVSDARIGHLDYFKNRFEPFGNLDEGRHIRVDTGADMADCMRRILSAL